MCKLRSKVLGKMLVLCSSKLPSKMLVLSIKDSSWVQLRVPHNIRKPQDAIMIKGNDQWGNEELEDLIEATPHYDQFIHSIQGMMPHGLEAVN